jgi:hypothetical protein
MNDTIDDTSRPSVQTEATLRDALLDSRQRWRDLVTMGADLAYETDEWGRFVFVSSSYPNLRSDGPPPP